MKETLDKLSNRLLSGPAVAEILGNPNVFPTQLIERLSIETVKLYDKGEIGYLQGDLIMNNLYGFWTTNDYFFTNYAFPQIALRCFEAFDAGEYKRETDGPNVDVAEKYTKPLIRTLLDQIDN